MTGTTDGDVQTCDNCGKVCFETCDLWIQGFRHFYSAVRNARDEPVEQECTSKSFELHLQGLDYVIWCNACFALVWPELRVLLLKWMKGVTKDEANSTS